jgi:hypothetical protein
MVSFGRQTLAHVLSRLLIFLMVQAILLPVYGPWLNRHFIEWQPTHAHIYLGKIDLDHHAIQLACARNSEHHHADEAACNGESSVVSLPNQDIAGKTLALSPPHKGAILATKGEVLLFTFVESYIRQRILFVLPLEKPPRI